MPNDRIRQKMKAAGKNLRDIIRERNEAMAAYAIALCYIDRNSTFGATTGLKKRFQKRAKKFAFKHQDDLLQRKWTKYEK